jgi:hypothetical protein
MMITASTISEYEAKAAAAALEGIPPDIGWTVYLRGTLFRERDARPASRPDLSGANPPGEKR